jgi:hypothetical protein
MFKKVEGPTHMKVAEVRAELAALEDPRRAKSTRSTVTITE